MPRRAALRLACLLLPAAVPAAAALEVVVPGTSNPYLAGMPAGTEAYVGDFAPDQSPVQVPLDLPPGQWVRFSNITGFVNHGPDKPTAPPEGDLLLIDEHRIGPEHGKSDIVAPVNSLLGVFLDDQVPSEPAPERLVFAMAFQRNYLVLTPAIRQVFFIGNGVTDAGFQQHVRIPPGATRLFLGTMDGKEWNNNQGSFTLLVDAVSPPADDRDGDGVPDAADGCPDDPFKYAAGDCGCGVPDTDWDGNGTSDCLEQPGMDRDFDGVPDAYDGCPDDPHKSAPGFCGCGTPDTDSDSDGIADCIDHGATGGGTPPGGGSTDGGSTGGGADDGGTGGGSVVGGGGADSGTPPPTDGGGSTDSGSPPPADPGAPGESGAGAPLPAAGACPGASTLLLTVTVAGAWAMHRPRRQSRS